MLLNSYYGTAHNSQPNYIAQISGQGPNQQMQFDCQMYSDFQSTGTVAPGQYLGSGCVFPEEVPSLPVQMTRKHLRWKGYMDDMGRSCRHPAPNTQDPTQHATSTNAYAVRHNPFVYFHSIIDRHGVLRAARGRHRPPAQGPAAGADHAEPVLHHPGPVPRRPRRALRERPARWPGRP